MQTIRILCITYNNKANMSWFENFYSEFSPIVGLFQGQGVKFCFLTCLQWGLEERGQILKWMNTVKQGSLWLLGTAPCRKDWVWCTDIDIYIIYVQGLAAVCHLKGLASYQLSSQVNKHTNGLGKDFKGRKKKKKSLLLWSGLINISCKVS